MVVEPLFLNNNEYALSLLEEVGRSKVQNAKHAAIVQNAPIYYQCCVDQAPSRHHVHGPEEQAREDVVQELHSPKFPLLVENQMRPGSPSWLTMDVMGKTTQTDKGERNETHRTYVSTTARASNVMQALQQ